MDCIIDYESYESLKDNYGQLLDCNRVLESENESLLNSNKVLKRLLIALENIKTSLEQKVLILQSNYNVKYTEQLVPFDRELQRLDEEYCLLKNELNRLEFDDGEEETAEDVVQEVTEPAESKFAADQHLAADEHSLMGQTSDSIADTDHYPITGRLIDPLDGEDLDESCVQFVVHQFMPADGETTADEQHADESSADMTANSASIDDTILNSSLMSADSPAKKSRPKRVKLSSEPGTKRFKCSWEGCLYATDSSGNYQKHYRIHTGEKPYKCDFEGCDYSCSDPGSIKEHKRIHSSEKQFSCDWPGCTWKFNTYKLLKNHTRACHTMEKPHKCDWPGCDKSFLAPYALRVHKFKHSGDRPHKCDQDGCTASFTRSTDLARHKRETHCTERNWQCEHENCGAKFYRKDDLKHHIRRKHDCPQFGRRRRPNPKTNENGKNAEKTNKRGKSSGQTIESGEGTAGEGLEESKVVIDLNVAKVNQLRKSILINFV